MSLGVWLAIPFLRTGVLLQSDHLDRLLLDIIKRVRLIFDLMEINGKYIDATDVAVPCCPVIEFHRSLICHSSELRRTRQILGYIGLCMLVPTGISKLFRIWKACTTVSNPFAHTGDVVWKNVARTNLEGAVKSPGSPNIPLPCPRGSSVMPGSLALS